jgi:hypothetical protein
LSHTRRANSKGSDKVTYTARKAQSYRTASICPKKKKVFAVNKTNLFIIVLKTNVINRVSLLLMRFKTQGINYVFLKKKSYEFTFERGRDENRSIYYRKTSAWNGGRERKGNAETQLFILGNFFWVSWSLSRRDRFQFRTLILLCEGYFFFFLFNTYEFAEAGKWG